MTWRELSISPYYEEHTTTSQCLERAEERLERDGMGRGESLLARGRHAFSDVWSLLKVLADILYPRVVAVLPAPASAGVGGGGHRGALLLPAPSGRA